MEQSYKEKYEQALAKAKEQYNYPCMRSCMGILEEIFPELKESEDEKVRKRLIADFGTIGKKEWGGLEVKDILAWLEKQEGCEYIKKDWLEHIKQSWYKEGLIDGKYSGGTSKEWTINDAATLKELIDFLENGTAKLQHDLTRYANWLKNQFTPIIERQGEQNFEMKTAEESLGIDSNTYNKIVDECLFGEQKPADKVEPKFKVGDKIYLKPEYRMPDDDTPIANTVKEIRRIDDKHYRFDGSYIFIEDQDKYELVEQKVEENNGNIGGISSNWSVEDEQHIDSLLKRLDALCRNKFERTRFAISEDRDWLKSLRPQNRWKPSDEQMGLLQAIINEPNNAASESCQIVLKDILEKLKKLKEE